MNYDNSSISDDLRIIKPGLSPSVEFIIKKKKKQVLEGLVLRGICCGIYPSLGSLDERKLSVKLASSCR